MLPLALTGLALRRDYSTPIRIPVEGREYKGEIPNLRLQKLKFYLVETSYLMNLMSRT